MIEKNADNEPQDDAADANDATPHEYRNLTDAIRELIDVMRSGGIASLDVKRGDLRISLRAQRAAVGQPEVVPAPIVVEPGGIERPSAPVSEGVFITSPMIGTYYAASSPGERPFVEVGDRVEVGQTVAIIEAMKIMNEITAERSGVVAEIYVTNGEAVEYGHRLMRLRIG